MSAWKAGTFAVGLAWLLWGARYLAYPDWDYGVSLLMAFSTLACAQWVVAVLMERRYRHWPLAAALDMNYLWRSPYASRNDELPYEKSMLSEWFERRFCRPRP